MKPRKRFSQNFLQNQSVVFNAVEQTDISPEDIIIEVGPGKGFLTQSLLKYNNPLHVVEIDRDLCNGLTGRFSDYPQLTVHNKDILKMDWNAELFGGSTASYKIISNLPYHISSQFLLKLFHHRFRVKKSILMLQREFADRILGDHFLRKDQYGALSVLFSLFFDRKKIMSVLPEDFYPVPKVHSTLISLKANSYLIDNETEFSRFVRDSFMFKRKYFSKSLNQYLLKNNLPSERAERVSEYLTVRPDNISAKSYAEIFELITGS